MPYVESIQSPRSNVGANNNRTAHPQKGPHTPRQIPASIIINDTIPLFTAPCTRRGDGSKIARTNRRAMTIAKMGQ